MSDFHGRAVREVRAAAEVAQAKADGARAAGEPDGELDHAAAQAAELAVIAMLDAEPEAGQ